MWYVYILLCKDGSFYTGISENVENRLEIHNKGKGSKYTRARGTVELLYVEQCGLKSKALRREIEIKSLSKKNKLNLIKFGTGKRFPSSISI